ncbi:MAG: hypothetical protein ACYC6W_09825 [Nitrosotalea sp.]
MQYTAKTMLLTMSIMGIAMTLVVGQMVPVLAQTIPTSSNLVKRDFATTDDQHTTSLYGNNKVCGDHMCAPGEWDKLKASLNQAQISHPAANSTKTVSVAVSTNVTTTASTNSTVPVPPVTTPPVTPTPQPVPTPPSTPSSVCVAIKAALGNSTVSAVTVTKIMSDLGCTS